MLLTSSVIEKRASHCNMMAEGFLFIYLDFRFSKVENLSLSAWVRCNMSAGVRGEDVSFRDVKIKIPDRIMTGG